MKFEIKKSTACSWVAPREIRDLSYKKRSYKKRKFLYWKKKELLKWLKGF